MERIINHHSYKRPYGMAHDISLLKLRKSAQINQAVNLACLPESSGEVSDGKMCWVTGNNIILTLSILLLCKFHFQSTEIHNSQDGVFNKCD